MRATAVRVSVGMSVLVWETPAGRQAKVSIYIYVVITA